MDYEILAVYDGFDARDAQGNTIKRMDFLVTSSTILPKLPACAPGSRAVNATFLRAPLDTAAYLAVKQLDGSWA